MAHASDLYDVIVVGGGASGLAAAIAAARSGARTCIVEQDVACGLPILATGNGRCNLSNSRLDAHRYRHPDAARTVFGSHPERDLDEFFSSLGLITTSVEGRLYPASRRADSVRDVLLDACERSGVEMRCCSKVVSARPLAPDVGWELTLREPNRPIFARDTDKAELRRARRLLDSSARSERTVCSRSTIIAVGGRSQDTCELFHLPHIQEEPQLCPIACTLASGKDAGAALAQLDGLRIEAMLTLKRKGAGIGYEDGEILFRDYGISGIAAFNLSRRCQAGDLLEIDLFPHLNDSSLLDSLVCREDIMGAYTGDARWFDGMLARPLAEVITHMIGRDGNPLKRLSSMLHRLPLRVEGLAGQQQAQVRRGGIPLSAIDLSLCKIEDGAVSGLFACGEALDMDADCGGYNLAWAWTTGVRAGTAAAHAR